MKVYTLEFNFFCGVSWSNKTVKITALNRFQLIRAFLDESRWMNERRTQKELWKHNEKYIVEDKLTFPIVTEHLY